MPQPWPLSERADKKRGTCSVCRATCQLKKKDGTVHRHGARNNPCPGSDLAPMRSDGSSSSSGRLAASSTVCSSQDTAAGSQSADPSQSVSDPSSQPHAVSQPDRPTLLSFLDENGCAFPIVKHIPRSARPTCVSHLMEVLRAILNDIHNVEHWHRLLLWPLLVLSTPKRGGKRNQVAVTIKKRISSYKDLDPLTLISGCGRQKPSAFQFGRRSQLQVGGWQHQGCCEADLQ